MARVSSIEERHALLLDRYYENAIISENPLIKDLFFGYKNFKRRNFINENLAVNEAGIVNSEALDLITSHHNNIYLITSLITRQHNIKCLNSKVLFLSVF